MTKIIIIFLAALITGCSHQAVREYDSYKAANKPRIESGEMLRSDYFKGLYEIASKADGVANQADAMAVMNTMIEASLAFESGKITKQEFDAIQRAAEVDMAKSKSYHSSQSRAAWGEALRRYGETAYRPVPIQQHQIPTPTRCTSQRTGDTVYTNCN